VIHRTGDKTVSVEGGRDMAAYIPGARLFELPGSDHLFYVGENAGESFDAIEEFLTGSRTSVPVDRVLATVLSPTLWIQQRRPLNFAINVGAIFLAITQRSGAISSAFVARK